MSSLEARWNDSSKISSGLKSNSLTIVENTRGNSEVWQNFGFVASIEANGSAGEVIPGYAACRLCNAAYKHSKNIGTSAMLSHKKTCNVSASASKQPLITQALGAVKVPQAAKQAVAEACVDFVCRDMRSFQAVEGEGFETVIQAAINAGVKHGRLNAKDLLPSRNTVKARCLKRASALLQCLASLLKKPLMQGRVAFSTDLWTDNYKKRSYMDLNVYWIDEEFEYRNQILGCVSFKEQKTGEKIKEKLSR